MSSLFIKVMRRVPAMVTVVGYARAVFAPMPIPGDNGRKESEAQRQTESDET